MRGVERCHVELPAEELEKNLTVDIEADECRCQRAYARSWRVWHRTGPTPSHLWAGSDGLAGQLGFLPWWGLVHLPFSKMYSLMLGARLAVLVLYPEKSYEDSEKPFCCSGVRKSCGLFI